MNSYKNFFNPVAVLNYTRKFLKSLGIRGTYSILLLFNAFKRSDTPLWAKNIIIGTIGYFLSPIDAIPDLTPIVGMTDDLGVLSFGLVTIACYINNDVVEKSKSQLEVLFGAVDPKELEKVEAVL